jgi:hypothetical protein
MRCRAITRSPRPCALTLMRPASPRTARAGWFRSARGHKADTLSDRAMNQSDTAVPEPKPAKKERRAPPQTGKPSKSSELDAAAAKGIMPEKPIVTSKANPHYQKRFDYLAERGAAADWPAVEAYEVKGINSYAKMLKQYRDRLLAAHAAVTASGAV